MEYRPLGRTGVQVSTLCLGVMMFGRKTEQDEATRMVDRFLDAGGNFVDTANVYSRGVSEEMTGKALAGGKRQRVVLATKVHGKMDDVDPNAWGNHRRNITQACDDSLRRLGTDYIDLYQIHRPQSSVPIDETLRALDDLVRAGKGALYRHEHLCRVATDGGAMGCQRPGVEPLCLPSNLPIICWTGGLNVN